MYELSHEEYELKIRELVRDETDRIRQRVSEQVYELIASHVPEPDEHEDFIGELTSNAINLIKEQL